MLGKIKVKECRLQITQSYVNTLTEIESLTASALMSSKYIGMYREMWSNNYKKVEICKTGEIKLRRSETIKEV